ncbi:MAG TPA: mechanosensitive ion channel family protein [Pyrinomonadaceae bacterium]|nr:mechanosensitive ion channel family protein [Pyrinomonadaceae bacterium]
MPVSDLRKKTVFFLLSTAIITLTLLIIPSDTTIETYLMDYFGVKVVKEVQQSSSPANTNTATPENTPQSKIVRNDGMMASQFSETLIFLLLNLIHIFKVILGMALVIITVRYINFLIFNVVIRNASQNEIASLVRTILSVIICIVAFFIIFQSQYPSVQLAPLFTGSTILGIVVGLALQDTLGNLFAGIALQADQPFQVGDVINVQKNSYVGVVESVSWRGVKVRTFQNKIVVISNSSLGKEYIEVAPRDNLNARLVFFNTLYANSPAKTAHVIREAVRQCENVSAKLRPIVRIRNLGDNGIDWEIKYWLDDYTKFNDTDALIRERVWYTFQREQLEFAYPTRTIHIETKPQESAFIEPDSEIIDLISGIPLFEPLTDEEMDKIAGSSSLRVFAPKEKIVRRGQKGNSMFIVNRGSVTVQIREKNKIKPIRTLKAGEFFGEMALFTGEPRSATVVADEEAEVLEIKHHCLKPIIEKNPELVESFGEIIERRRAALNQINEPSEITEADKSGVFLQIRKFFGLRK